MPLLSNMEFNRMLIGGLAAGKKWASGTFTSIYQTLTVNGLAFQPSHIIVHGRRNSTTINNNICYSNIDPPSNKANEVFGIIDDAGGRGYGATVWTINTDGFSVNYGAAYLTGSWIAIE